MLNFNSTENYPRNFIPKKFYYFRFENDKKRIDESLKLIIFVVPLIY